MSKKSEAAAALARQRWGEPRDTVQVSATVPRELAERLDEIASERGITRAALIRATLEGLIEKK